MTDPAVGRGTSLQNSAASESPCYENRAGGVKPRPFFVASIDLWQYSSREPIPIVAMSILAKLLIAVCVVVLLSVIIERPQAQLITQQQTQRPRRVTGTDQTTESKKPDEVDEGDVVRVDTQLVSVPAVVTDSAGHPLSGLRPENFRLIEDGQPQTIANLDRKSTRLNS